MSTSVKDGNAVPFNMDSTEDETGLVQFIQTSRSFELAVSMGQIPGYSTIDKFGENPLIDTGSAPEDIWEGSVAYTYDADGTAPIVSLISDNAADTTDIQIQGLDIDGNEVIQILTLTGTTRVPLTTALWRVYRMENVGTSSIAGMVYCYIGTGGVPAIGSTRALINDGNNQSLMAIYTVPKGKVAFLYKGEIGMSRPQIAGEARAAYYSRRLGKVFKVKKRVNITNQGSSVYQDYRSFPDVIPALTDIRLSIESVSADNMGVFGTFDLLLVDEGKLSSAFLTAIGQPS